jgi:hypothetical protein
MDDELALLLQSAHPVLLMNCPGMYQHAQHGYRMGGRGALTVHFTSVDTLREFVRGRLCDQQVNYYDLLQVMRFGCPDVDEFVSTYDPFNSFVLVTSVLNPVSKRLGFSSVLAPHDAVARLMAQFILSRSVGGSPASVVVAATPPPRLPVAKKNGSRRGRRSKA